MTDDAARAVALADAVDAQRDQILDVTRFVNRHPKLAHGEPEYSRHVQARSRRRSTCRRRWPGWRLVSAPRSPAPRPARTAAPAAAGAIGRDTAPPTGRRRILTAGYS